MRILRSDPDRAEHTLDRLEMILENENLRLEHNKQVNPPYLDEALRVLRTYRLSLRR